MNLQFWKNALFCCCLFAITACSDEETVNPPASTEIPEQPAELAEQLAQYNSDIAALQLMVDGEVEVVDYTSDEQHNYTLELSDGKIVNAALQAETDTDIPAFAINEDGYWEYQLGGEKQTLTDLSGNPVPARKSLGKGTFTPQLALGEDGCWQMSLNGAHWKKLSDTPAPSLEGKTAASYSLFKSVTENEDGTLSLALSGGEMVLSIDATVSSSAQAWKKFFMKSEDNVLLDFSYAGYKHGEEEAPDGFALGYETINVKEYMDAHPDLTAREAFLNLLKEKKLVRIDDESKSYSNANARVVFYFPAGEYVLHNEEDNTLTQGVENPAYDGKGNNTSSSIIIYGGNFVIKGDGPDKTFIKMDTPNLPTDTKVMYSSPVMINIKHNAWLGAEYEVTGNADKGTFKVKVAGASNFKVGEWVCLYLQDNSPELVKQELLPYAWESTMTNISTKGVQVEDYHQIVNISGDEITFKEPIMHEVDAQWNWKLRKYSCYENVGVEDLTFVGHAVDDFKHHRSWIDDGAYKPIAFMRVVNSWMRRVNFESVSEAASIISSANFSAYKINITGNRGHAAIRSQGSSRVFIGAVRDCTDGPLADEYPTPQTNTGQYHACGVSKPSMGAVIWKVTWGDDACFESHATQPRATLIDNCTGGFVQSRQGGDDDQVPNHLNDLTIWNMCSTNTKLNGNGTLPANGEFDWWRTGWRYWKILPPIIVGFHGDPVKFVQEQVKLDESNGVSVEPQSLYEAQLKRRLGYVPAWLSALK